VRFEWDQKKNERLMKERNIDFNEVIEIFGHAYHLSQKNDDPEQWRAVGWVKGRLVPLIYEEREDETEVYYWFVTAWNATSAERKLFNES